MTDRKKTPNIPWTDEDWVVLMEIVISRKVVPIGRHWDEIAAEYYKRTGKLRKSRAMQAAFQRLRDSLQFFENKKLWPLVVGHPKLFEIRQPGTYPRRKPKRPKVEERVDRLESQLAEVADNVSLILENLTKGV